MCDLIITNLSVSPNNPLPGGAVTITFTVANIAGGASEGPTSAYVYLSTDSTINGSDTLLAMVATPIVAANGSIGRSVSVTLPANLTGTFYIGAIADAATQVSEINENNNTSAPFQIVIGTPPPPPPPDLVVSSLTGLPATITVGDAVSLNYAIANNGGSSAPTSTTGVYLSTDATIDASDRLLTTDQVAALTAGAVVPGGRNVGFTLPEDVAPGAYYIGVLADKPGAITEGSETNNTAAFAVTVEARSIFTENPDVVTLEDPAVDAHALDGNDYVIGTPQVDSIYGDAGDDTLVGLASADQLFGGDDNDKLYAVSEDALVSAAATDGGNVLDGGNGNDELYGSGGAESLLGGAGDDKLFGRGGADLLNGGTGTDFVTVTRTALTTAYTLDFSQATGDVTNSDGARFLGLERLRFEGGSGAETVVGGLLDDFMLGGAGNDTFSGGGGSDHLEGNADNDTLGGDAGADFLDGGEGDDKLFGGPGADELFGGNGNDNLYIIDTDASLDGGAGFDQVIVLNTAGVTVTLPSSIEYAAGNIGPDVLNATGAAFAMTIGGAEGDDILTGGNGNDTLAGAAGADQMNGGPGNDIIFGGPGADNFSGGDGDDKLYILGNDGIVDGGAGFDQAIILDTSGVTLTLGNGVEYAAGNAGNDTIDARLLSIEVTLGGADGNDTVYGSSVADIISGGNGNDTVKGFAGNDQLFGGPGNDDLYGGLGNDNMTLGTGIDNVFIEENGGTDYIYGFENGIDHIHLSLASVHSFADLVVTGGGRTDPSTTLTYAGGQIIVVGTGGFIDATDFIFS